MNDAMRPKILPRDQLPQSSPIYLPPAVIMPVLSRTLRQSHASLVVTAYLHGPLFQAWQASTRSSHIALIGKA